MPKYSIIIPTRNRAHLMRYALQCALSQTFDDYEIIVSDNNSSDDTHRVVQEIGKGRVRYFQTKETMSMPDHWEWILKEAQGDWVTYLTDDSAISSHLLSEVDRTLDAERTDVVVWSHFSRYFHATWHQEDQRNTLTYHPFSGKRIRVQSKPVIERFYSLYGGEMTAPVALNSFCRRTLMNEIQKRAGRFFISPCPDVSSCVLTLSMTPSYVFIDLPLGINGIGKESIGMSQATRRDKAAEEFHKEFQDPIFQNVPLSAAAVVNYISESLLRAKKGLPDKLSFASLDWARYYSYVDENLRRFQRIGVDVTDERREYQAVFSRIPISLKFKVYRYNFLDVFNVSARLAQLRNLMRAVINRSSLLVRLESKFRERPTFGETIWGRESGFNNIYEATQYLDRRILSGLASKQPASDSEPALVKI